MNCLKSIIWFGKIVKVNINKNNNVYSINKC